MKSVIQWLAGNVASMLLSLVLAALAWVVAVEEADPTVENPFPQAVPVTIANLADGMVVVGEFADQVEFTIRAPQSVWETLQIEDFTAELNLDGLDAGVYDVPISWALDREPTRVVSVEPDTVRLEVVPETARTIPVQVHVEDEPALGYIMQTVAVTPSQVTVRGPSPYVALVVEAVAPVSVEDADATIEQDVRVQPYDEEGKPVSLVSMIPEQVSVRVPIELSVYYRSLGVKAVLTGTFASGYRITNISVNPPRVTVFGSPGVIAALPGFIETRPIDVEGAQDDVIVRPNLSVPHGVSVVMEEQPLVSVNIEPIQSSLTRAVTPTIQGLEPGLTATISPETVETILSGPLPLLESLTDADVRVMVNLLDLEPGTHQLEPQVVVPEGVVAQSVNPATVQVDILALPTRKEIESTTGATRFE